MVIISTIEAEYIALTQTTQQILWLTKFFDKIGFPMAIPVVIHANNNRSISNSINDKNYQQTKTTLLNKEQSLGK